MRVGQAALAHEVVKSPGKRESSPQPIYNFVGSSDSRVRGISREWDPQMRVRRLILA